MLEIIAVIWLCRKNAGNNRRWGRSARNAVAYTLALCPGMGVFGYCTTVFLMRMVFLPMTHPWQETNIIYLFGWIVMLVLMILGGVVSMILSGTGAPLTYEDERGDTTRVETRPPKP